MNVKIDLSAIDIVRERHGPARAWRFDAAPTPRDADDIAILPALAPTGNCAHQFPFSRARTGRS